MRNLIGVVASLLAISAVSAAQLSCEDAGFSNLVLCSDCKQLESFVQDAELVGDCLRCCSPDEEKDEGPFTKATLEICPRGIRYVAMYTLLFFIEEHTLCHRFNF